MAKSILNHAIKAPLEVFTRVKIEDKLKSLKYNLDEQNVECNIFRERPKTEAQHKLLKGKKPDFLIYERGSDNILAVIEAKRPGMQLNEAIDQAIELYAKPLNIPVVFVYNGSTLQACSKDRKPVKIDNIELNDFVDEETLKKLIEGNFDIESTPEGFSISRADLLSLFKKANNLLRKAGLRDGYERFSFFSDLMFLKLKNDFDDIGDVPYNKNLDKNCNWKRLINKLPSEKMDLD